MKKFFYSFIVLFLVFGTILRAEIVLKAHGGAVQFPGQTINDNVVLPTINALNNTQHFTIETWVKISSTHPYGNIFNYKVSTDDRIVIQQLDTGKLHVIIGNSFTGNSNHQGQYPMLTNDVWHHLSVSYDGTQSTNTAKLKVYVDGVLQTATYLDSMPSTTANLSSVFPEIGTALNGQIDEFRIWDSSRSQSEIQTTMNKQLDGNETGLMAYYNFDERTGVIVKDISGNNHHGTTKGDVTRLNFLGDGLHYIGTSDTVALSGINHSTGNTSFSTWIKLDALSNSVVYHKDLVETYWIDETGKPFGRVGNGSSWNEPVCTANSSLSLNQWHHLTYTYNATSKSFNIYIDGTLDKTCTQTTVLADNFNESALGNNGLKATLNEVSFWDKSLVETEIKKLMVSSPNLNDSSLLAYFPLNEGSGTKVKNYKASIDGTISGATWVNTAPMIYGSTIYTAAGINSSIKPVLLASNTTPIYFQMTNAPTSTSLTYNPDNQLFSILNIGDGIDGTFVLNTTDNGVNFTTTAHLKHLGTFTSTVNDTIIAPLVNYTIDGLDGNDTLILNGIKSSYIVTKNEDGNFTVVGGGFTYTLINIEELSFSDVQNVSIGSLVSYSPVITSTPITTVHPNIPYVYSLNATDANNDLLTWSVKSGTTLPSWLSVYSGSNSLISPVAEAD